jgi:hypothetical protein
MSHASKEIVYVNSGAIYKAPSHSELQNNYRPSNKADPIFQFEKSDGKKYLFTSEFKRFFSDTDTDGTSLLGIDLCPAVNLWICLGAVTSNERSNYDIFFAAESTEQLRKVAEYYGLPYPISTEIGEQLNAAPETMCFWNAGGLPVVPGGIKFIDGKPALLKLYTYPKVNGSWDVYMYGAAYYAQGKCYERGAVYEMCTGGKDLDLPNVQMRGSLSYRKAEMIQSERFDGAITHYSYTRNTDPAMFWQGNELSADGLTQRTKQFETSMWLQIAIAKQKRGVDLSDRNLCPDVKFWLGRSWYEGEDGEELLFAVTGGTAMLEAVAAYYALPVPYNKEQAHILDTKPELYRARHYDLLGQGLGEYINVVVASVIFKCGKPEKLILYTFLRQWEFDEEINLPMF